MEVSPRIERQQEGWSLDESKRAERYAEYYFTGMVEMDTIAVANRALHSNVNFFQ
jgi:hypothetical protein